MLLVCYVLSSSTFIPIYSFFLNSCFHFSGEEDIIHQHTEAEAHDGNPFAQTWLAKKYFWGLGGLQRNEMLARYVQYFLLLILVWIQMFFVHSSN